MQNSIYEAAWRERGVDPLTRHQHIHNDCYEFLQIVSGDGGILVGNRLWPLAAGDFYFINAMQLHSTNPRDVDSYVRSKLIFSARWANSLISAAGCGETVGGLLRSDAGKRFRLSKDGIAEADSLFKSAAEIFGQSGELREQGGELIELNRDVRELRLSDIMLRLLLLIYGEASTGDMADSREFTVKNSSAVLVILKYLSDHLTEPVTVERVSEETHISKYYMCRLFRSATGMTIMRYLLSQRLAAAKTALLKTDLPISEIALSSGFSSFSYFSRVFGEREGMSPHDFRERARLKDGAETFYARENMDAEEDKLRIL